MIDLNEISEMLQKGKAKLVKDMVQQALDEGMDPAEILEKGLLSGMSVIGDKFQKNEVFVPEVLIAARAMTKGMEVLKEKLVEEGVQAKGVAVIGTVRGDLHDIGKNLVRMMMEGKGITVVDLGVDVSPEQFVNAAIENKANIICCSSLLTTTMGEMKNVVEEATKRGIRDQVKIMVGGAPVTDSFCEAIGADCYTSDAASASKAAYDFCTKG